MSHMEKHQQNSSQLKIYTKITPCSNITTANNKTDNQYAVTYVKTYPHNYHHINTNQHTTKQSCSRSMS